jgi:hypothetical protein
MRDRNLQSLQYTSHLRLPSVECNVMNKLFFSISEAVFLCRSSLRCTHPQISLGRSSQGELGGQGMWHAWERREKCTGS